MKTGQWKRHSFWDGNFSVVPTKELKRVRDEYIEKYLKPLLEVHKNETLRQKKHRKGDLLWRRALNPNRMELSKLKRQLVVAKRGHKLLKDKQDALVKAFLEKARAVWDLRQEIERR